MNLMRGTFPHLCPGDGCAICARLKAKALIAGVDSLWDQRVQIRKLSREGYSISELAEYYRTSPEVITRVLKRAA